jgi:hypothetical protein
LTSTAIRSPYSESAMRKCSIAGDDIRFRRLREAPGDAVDHAPARVFLNHAIERSRLHVVVVVAMLDEPVRTDRSRHVLTEIVADPLCAGPS